MKRFALWALFLFVATPSQAAQKPSQGKVRFYVTIDEDVTYKGKKQRTSELEESASDLRGRLKNSKWVEVTDDLESADIRLRILGRRRDQEKGRILGYFLDAGAFKTEDEFSYVGQAVATGGIRSTESGRHGNNTQGRAMLGWGELAKRLAESLEEFAEANYDRLVSQRPEH